MGHLQKGWDICGRHGNADGRAGGKLGMHEHA